MLVVACSFLASLAFRFWVSQTLIGQDARILGALFQANASSWVLLYLGVPRSNPLLLAHLLYLLQDIHITCSKLLILNCDNQSALHIAANPVFHERTKHLGIDYHIVREKLLAGVMKLLPLSSKDQLADFFTKALLPQPFGILLAKLGMVDIYHPPTCGGY
jgi:hypothetical protein